MYTSDHFGSPYRRLVSLCTKTLCFCCHLCSLAYTYRLGYRVASFPDPSQLSVACSTEKRERAWNNLSRK